jgi:hypothetical protein
VHQSTGAAFLRGASKTGETAPDGLSAHSGRVSADLNVIDLDVEAHSWEPGHIEVRDAQGETVIAYDAPAVHLADPTCASFPLAGRGSAGYAVSVPGADLRIRGVTTTPISFLDE